MLWTRALPEGDASHTHSGQVPLLVQLSASSDFSDLLLQAELNTSAASDYTVRAPSHLMPPGCKLGVPGRDRSREIHAIVTMYD